MAPIFHRPLLLLYIFSVLEGKQYFIDWVFLHEGVDNKTFAQAAVNTLHEYDINNRNVLGIVTDNAAYCIKAVRDVLQNLYPNAIRIPCLAHVINLVGDEFCKAKYFQRLQEFCAMFKSAFYKKGSGKRRFLEHMESCGYERLLALSPRQRRSCLKLLPFNAHWICYTMTSQNYSWLLHSWLMPAPK